MLLTIAVLAGAATLTVGVDADYATISDAVAASSAEDIIEIGPGVYTESVNLLHNLTLQGAGADVTVLVNPGVEWIVTGDVGFTLADLTLDGNGVGGAASGGVYLRRWLLDRVVVQNTTDGAGVYMSGGGDLLVRDCTFRDHTGGAYTEALLFSGGALRVERTTFVDIHGYAFFGRPKESAVFRDSTFLRTGDDATQATLYIYADGASVTVAGCTFDGNVGREGSAISLGGFIPSARIVNNRFLGNIATRGGAVFTDIWTTSAPVDIVGNLFADNTESTRWAGAITAQVHHSSTEIELRIANNTFVGNVGSDAAHARIGDARWGMANNLFAGGDDSIAVDADRAPVFEDHNLFPAFDLAFTAGTPGKADVFGVPGFVSWTDDGDPHDDDYRLAPDSPAIDAGAPWRTDPDGSPSDIGAF